MERSRRSPRDLLAVRQFERIISPHLSDFLPSVVRVIPTVPRGSRRFWRPLTMIIIIVTETYLIDLVAGEEWSADGEAARETKRIAISFASVNVARHVFSSFPS